MSEKKKPLPAPPDSPFSPKKRFRKFRKPEPLTADGMIQATAEGKLDSYLEQRFQDNEQAKNLARLMINLTGMAPPGTATPEENRKQETSDSQAVPGDVQEASQSGNVGQLIELLKREHAERSKSSAPPPPAAENPGAGTTGGDMEERQTSFDRKTLDRLIRIASENNVSVNWVVARAIQLYVRDYEQTGRM